MTDPARAREEPFRTIRPVHRPEEAEALRLPDLSEHFQPFLHHFMRESLRCGGEVQVSTTAGEPDGIFLYHDVEREASIFTRDRAVAEAFHRLRDHVSVFSEVEVAARSDVFLVYAADLGERTTGHRFSHSVRAAVRRDRPAVLALLRGVYDQVDERWLESAPYQYEACFVVDGAGELAGAGWVTVVNGHGRLHSLTVGPRYRRSGVGWDLFWARLQWCQHAGATHVISEISEHNVASRAIAEAGGMRAIGKMYRSQRP
jgi:GNAT superfamily N-acetyltransferase